MGFYSIEGSLATFDHGDETITTIEGKSR